MLARMCGSILFTPLFAASLVLVSVVCTEGMLSSREVQDAWNGCMETTLNYTYVRNKTKPSV